MNKLFLTIVTSSIILFASCGGSENKDANSMRGKKEVELKINGNSLLIIVPDSLKGKMEIIEQSWGATEIKVGNGFQLSITEGDGDIALMKTDIAGNDVNKFKKFVKDEPTLLFWESAITTSEYHFYMTEKIGNTSYIIEDIKGEVFDEKTVQGMIDAAQTLKPKDDKTKS